MAKKWDFKNSPAANKLRKVGKATVEYLGLTDPDDHGRNAHFEKGSTEHLEEQQPQTKTHTILEKDVPADDNFENRGVGVGSVDNITSIREGFAYRAKREMRRPKGY